MSLNGNYEITEAEIEKWNNIVGQITKRETLLHAMKKCGDSSKCKSKERLDFIIKIFNQWVNILI